MKTLIVALLLLLYGDAYSQGAHGKFRRVDSDTLILRTSGVTKGTIRTDGTNLNLSSSGVVRFDSETGFNSAVQFNLPRFTTAQRGALSLGLNENPIMYVSDFTIAGNKFQSSDGSWRAFLNVAAGQNPTDGLLEWDGTADTLKISATVAQGRITDLDDTLGVRVRTSRTVRIQGTSFQIASSNSAESPLSGNYSTTLSLANNLIIPGDYMTLPISTAPNDPPTPVSGMVKYQPADSGFYGWRGNAITKERFAMVADGMVVLATAGAFSFYRGVDTLDGSDDVRYDDTRRSLVLERGAAGPGRLDIEEDDGNGDQIVTITVPSSIASSYDFILPNADGTSGQVLTRGANSLAFDDVDAGLLDLTDNYAWTGIHNYTSGTLTLPNGTNGTAVSAAGRVTVDHTIGSINFNDNTAERVLSSVLTETKTLIVATTASDYHIWRVPAFYTSGVTIISISVLNEGAGDVVGTLYEMDVDGNNALAIEADMTCVAGTTNIITSIDNASLDPTDWVDWLTNTVAAANVQLAISFDYRVNP